jgi:hypothetical protein
VAGSCEHGNEPSSSIKGGEFLCWLRECLLLKKDSASLELVKLVYILTYNSVESN